MAPILTVDLLPPAQPLPPRDDEIAVAIDVLRASTTMITALANGARAILPLAEVTTALELARKTPPRLLLGGERHGRRIQGFDLGNSPAEYSAESVSGADILFTTTNGTRCLLAGRGAGRILIGAFVNLSTIVERLAAATRIRLMCAGTDGEVAGEDVWFAGAVVDRLIRLKTNRWAMNDAAKLACDAFRHQFAGEATRTALAEQFALTRGGRNLVEIGMAADLLLAAEVDRFPLVPEWDQTAGRICGG